MTYMSGKTNLVALGGDRNVVPLEELALVENQIAEVTEEADLATLDTDTVKFAVDATHLYVYTGSVWRRITHNALAG